MAPDLSICIVNHETPVLLKQCLRSIVETAQDVPVEVFVVNNTPDGDGAVQSLVADFPVQLLQNARPLGFAANQNRMLERAVGRYLMPLNSDTIVLSGALRELVDFMDAHPDVAIAGPRLTYADGRLQPSCRNFPGPLTHFLEASGLWQLFRVNRTIGRWHYLCGPHDRVREVDWLTGACLIVRAAAAREVGHYDAELFPGMYGEDLEWCWRMKRAGWRILFDPDALVVHLESQSPLSDRTISMFRAFYAFAARHYSGPRRWSVRAATILALLPKWLLARSAGARSTYANLMRLRMPSAERSRRYA
jgi:GT2 family glycosyltransferase